jgi:hypothetical protein
MILEAHFEHAGKNNINELSLNIVLIDLPPASSTSLSVVNRLS